jgi:hypothetical protein
MKEPETRFRKLEPKVSVKPLSENPAMKALLEKESKLQAELKRIMNVLNGDLREPYPMREPADTKGDDVERLLAGEIAIADLTTSGGQESKRRQWAYRKDVCEKALAMLNVEKQRLTRNLQNEFCKSFRPVSEKYRKKLTAAFEGVQSAMQDFDDVVRYVEFSGFTTPDILRQNGFEAVVKFGIPGTVENLQSYLENRKKELKNV